MDYQIDVSTPSGQIITMNTDGDNDTIHQLKLELSKIRKDNRFDLLDKNGNELDDSKRITSDLQLELHPYQQHFDVDNKVVIFLGVLSDGAGDFSFGNKLINLLLSIGIREENISLYIMNRSYPDQFQEHYQKMMEWSTKETYNEEDENLYQKSSDWDYYHTRITKEDFDVIFNIVTSFYDKMKRFHNLEDTVCTEKDLRELETQRTQIHSIYRKMREDKNKHLEKEDYSSYKCLIDHHFFQYIVDRVMISSKWKMLVNHSQTYLINPFPHMNIKILEGETIKVEEYKIEDKMIAIAFNSSYMSSQRIERLINIQEGGRCNYSNISPGFSPETADKCFGINVTTFSLETSSPYSHRYHLCYFSGLSSIIDPYGVLMGYKLLYLLDHVTAPMIYVNSVCYTLLSTYKQMYQIILGEYTVKNNEIIIESKGVYIRPFAPCSHDEFLTLLYHSEPICILSGDQSYFEGISMGKIVLYDFLVHKVLLLIQIYQMYQVFLNDQSRTTINIKSRMFPYEFLAYSQYIGQRKLFGSAQAIPYGILTDQDQVSSNVFETDIQRLEIYPEEFSFLLYKYDFSYYGKEYHKIQLSSPVNFKKSVVNEIYDKLLNICQFLNEPEKKKEFLLWIDAHYNFEKRLKKFIKYDTL